MPATIPHPILCLVTRPVDGAKLRLADIVEQAVGGGVNLVQLRDKEQSAFDMCGQAIELSRAIDGRALLFINDRIDVALACGADGVQISERGLATRRAKEKAGRRLLIGRSVHSAAGAAEAASAGADLLVLGTIFPTASHPEGPFGGEDLVRETTERVSIPVVAIGGVKAGNAGTVMIAGASGVAAISEIMDSPDPRAAAARLSEAVNAGLPPGKENGV